MIDNVVSEEREVVLQKRRELRKAKKNKAKQYKQHQKQLRFEKRAEIVAKIRAKRKETQDGYNTNENGCWLCGETTHRKENCMNRAAGDGSKTCFQCRRRGHTSHNCPQKNDNGGSFQQQQAVVCFNCGANDHSLRDCTNPKKNGGATYATCFVCNQQGHLSSKCPKNTMGVYPKGGCCKLCKSIKHLARNCPIGNISADGSKSARSNKKIVFANEIDDVVDQDDEDKTGDALDSFQLGLEGEKDGENVKQSTNTMKHRKNSKRVTF